MQIIWNVYRLTQSLKKGLNFIYKFYLTQKENHKSNTAPMSHKFRKINSFIVLTKKNEKYS